LGIVIPINISFRTLVLVLLICFKHYAQVQSKFELKFS